MIKRAIFSLAVAIAMTSGAWAQQKCNDVHLETKAVTYFQTLKSEDTVFIPLRETKRLKDLYAKHGLNETSLSPVVALDRMYKKLHDGLTAENSLQRADEMAKFGKEIMEMIPNLTSAKRKKIEFGLVEAVTKLESFFDHEATQSSTVVFERYPTFNYFKMNQFNKTAVSYVHRDEAYQALQQHTGVIDWSDIRDIFSNQTWIVEIKDHDAYHLHYAAGHPYYLSTVFRIAWSRNPKRYFLTSSLFEGIDSFQTGVERGIFNYMRAKPEFMKDGLFDLEGAIMYLARAPVAEIEAIAAQLISSYDSQYMQFERWRPRYATHLKTEQQRDQEINSYIQQGLQFVADPANASILPYPRMQLR